MSNELFFIADTYFSHTNMLKFEDEAGNRVRPHFSSVEEMNEALILNWNSVVAPEDRIYHLGDVCFGGIETVRSVLPRLNGKKRLILGNHDRVKGHELWKYFQDIGLWKNFDEHDFVATHIPILPTQFRRVKYNVHWHGTPYARYFPVYHNISCEMTNYTPIHLDVLKRTIEEKRNRK